MGLEATSIAWDWHRNQAAPPSEPKRRGPRPLATRQHLAELFAGRVEESDRAFLPARVLAARFVKADTLHQRGAITRAEQLKAHAAVLTKADALDLRKDVERGIREIQWLAHRGEETRRRSAGRSELHSADFREAALRFDSKKKAL